MRLPTKPPFLPSATIDIQRFGEPEVDALRTYVFGDVLDEIVFHASYREGPAVTLLTGGAYNGPAGQYIEIRGFTEAGYVDSLDQFRRQLAATYRRVHADFTGDDPTRFILGWSFGTQGGGADLSDAAMRLHLSFFNLPHQVFLSIDAETERFGFFHRTPEDGFANIGFNLVSTIDAEGHRSGADLTIATSPEGSA